jgi:hypothetical protein
LGEDRVVGYARILCFLFAATAVVWLALSPNLIGPDGKPVGTDFMDVWAAGKLALAGHPADAYDYARHFEIQPHALPWREGDAVPFFGWHYPPMFLLIAAGLAIMPYGVALAAWMAISL